MSKGLRTKAEALLLASHSAHGLTVHHPPYRGVQADPRHVRGLRQRVGVPTGYTGGVYDQHRRRHGVFRLATVQRLPQPAGLDDQPSHVRRAFAPPERGRDEHGDHHPCGLAVADRGARLAAQTRVFRRRARAGAGDRGRAPGAPGRQAGRAGGHERGPPLRHAACLSGPIVRLHPHRDCRRLLEGLDRAPGRFPRGPHPLARPVLRGVALPAAGDRR